MTARLRREHVCSGRQIQRARLWRETFQGRHDRALIVCAAPARVDRERGRARHQRRGRTRRPEWRTDLQHVSPKRRTERQQREPRADQHRARARLNLEKKVRVRIRKEAALRARFVADRSVLYIHGGLVAAEAPLRHLTPGRAAYWPSSPPCASSSCSCSW